jgi:hypothetical protein
MNRSGKRSSAGRHSIVWRLGFTPAAQVIFCGCSAMRGSPQRSDNPQAELRSLQKYFDPNIIDRYNAKPETDKRAFRDEVINGQIRAVDLNFDGFVQGLSQESVVTNLSTDVAILGLNGAGAVAAA